MFRCSDGSIFTNHTSHLQHQNSLDQRNVLTVYLGALQDDGSITLPSNLVVEFIPTCMYIGMYEAYSASLQNAVLAFHITMSGISADQ